MPAVCLEELPPPPSPLATNTTDEELRFINGSITYECPPGMATQDGAVNQTVMCSQTDDSGDNFAFQPSELKPCDGEPMMWVVSCFPPSFSCPVFLNV